MGIGIWSMHQIGMEDFRLPVKVAFDRPTVLLSLQAAVVSSAIAFFIVRKPTLSVAEICLGSAVMGGGIAAMHCIGMSAMRLPAICFYSPLLVAISVLLAVSMCFVALHSTFALKNDPSTSAKSEWVAPW
jgi:two-component system, sensor histidine kinase and response regulator